MIKMVFAEPGKISLRINLLLFSFLILHRWENMSHSDKTKGAAQSACFRCYYDIKCTPDNVLLRHMVKCTFFYRTENLIVTLSLDCTLALYWNIKLYI